MLLEAFNKQTAPEIKDKYSIYGDKLVRTIMSDISSYNKSVHRMHRIATRNTTYLNSMLKQTVGYITSYYIRASVENDIDATYIVFDKWRSYSRRMDTLLKKKKINNKDRRTIMMTYIKLVMCRACCDTQDYIDTYNYNKNVKTEKFTRDVIEKIGFEYFIHELFVQCYILSILKSLLQMKTSAKKYGRVYRGSTYVDFLNNTIFSPRVANYNLSLNKSRFYINMKLMKYMSFKPLEDSDYSLMISELLDSNNDMCKCVDEVENFLFNMNLTRDDDNKLTIKDIRVLGVI